MASSGVAPSREKCQNTFESAIAMSLHLWQPLSFAVENHLGGGDGADKRDWFGGAIAELFEDTWATAPTMTATTAATTDSSTASADDLLMDVEARLLQIMDDEFDTVVDDGSAYDVAQQIVRLWTQCRRGQFADVDALRRRWEAAQGRRVTGTIQAGPALDDDTAWDTEDEDEDEDEDDEDGDENDGGADVSMEDAPEEQPRRAPPPPEVDEDGFTKVTRKKR